MELDEMLKHLLESVKSSVESNEMIGKPIVMSDGCVVMPVSKVSYGFVMGGGEYGDEGSSGKLPCAAASGGGATVTPVGFLVCGKEKRFVRPEDVDGDGKWGDLFRSILNVFRRD